MKFFSRSSRADAAASQDAPVDIADAGSGAAMLQDLDRRTAMFGREVRFFEGTDHPLPVNVNGLITLRASPDQDGVSLDASRVATGALLMAAPRDQAQAPDFVRACVEQRVSQVIDLTARNAVSGASGQPMSAWSKPRDEVAFQPAPKGDWNLQDTLGDDACEYRVMLRAGQGEDSARHIAWTRVPRAEKAMSADTLLAACRLIAAHAPPDGGSVAFVDSNGGDVAATFAAANAIYRSHVRQPLEEAHVRDTVVNACLLLRSRRSVALLDRRPDLLVSLEDFSRRLIREGAGEPSRLDPEDVAALAAFAAVPERTPDLVHGKPGSPARPVLRSDKASSSRPSARGQDGGPRLGVSFDPTTRVAAFGADDPPKAVRCRTTIAGLDDREDKPEPMSALAKADAAFRDVGPT